jgi:hypothetical protein
MEPALVAGRKLTTVLLQRYPKLSDDDIGISYSGGRSVHVELPMPHWPDPVRSSTPSPGCWTRGWRRSPGWAQWAE